MGAHQKVLSKDIATDVEHSGSYIFWTPREVSRTRRDGTKPRDGNTVIAAAR